MNSGEMARLNAGILALFAPGLDSTNYAERAFALLTLLVPSDLNACGALKGASPHLEASFDRLPDGLVPALEAYGRLMHKYEPFRLDPGVNGGRPYSARDFYSRPKFRDLDIFGEVYGPMRYEDHCLVHVPAEAGTTVFFGLFRGGKFREEEKDLLRWAQPHLANARQLARSQTAAAAVGLRPEFFAKAGFTTRESDVLYWLVQGKANYEIADLLHVRTDTVSAHIRTIYTKMKVSNRVSATIEALAIVRRAGEQFANGAYRVPRKLTV